MSLPSPPPADDAAKVVADKSPDGVAKDASDDFADDRGTSAVMPMHREQATLVQRAEAGDAQARDLLFATLYDELHRLAQREVRRQGEDSPLSATTLLHEAYLAFGGRDGRVFPDQSHFLAYAARAMRGVLIDRVRARQAAKRGGGVRATTLDADYAEQIDDPDELLALHEALETLATLDPMLARVVDLKFFCGFTFAEIAAVQNVTERTVQRHWDKARALLRNTMRTQSH